MARHGQVSAGAGAPPEETAAPAGGDEQPDPGIAEGEVQIGRGGAGEYMPAAEAPPPAGRAGKGKKRVKCAALKGGKITVGKGEVVQIDENGFFEVSEAEAERLLTIPGYTE